jgi:hypothetical protein
MLQKDFPPLTFYTKAKIRASISSHPLSEFHGVPMGGYSFFRRSKKPEEVPGIYIDDDTQTNIYQSEDPPPYLLSSGEKYIPPFNPSRVTEGPSYRGNRD